MNHSFLKFDFKNTKNTKCKNIYLKVIALFSEHHTSEIFMNHELEFLGILDMVDGLEYHYKKFIRMENKHREHQKKIWENGIYLTPPNNPVHEAVAYLNRLGQVHTLLTSNWFKKNVKESAIARLCPSILALMPFRNKHTAHRSVDGPRGESPQQLAMHASIPFGQIWEGSKVEIDQQGRPVWQEEIHITYKITIDRNEKLNRSPILKEHKTNFVQGIEHVGSKDSSDLWLSFTPSKHHTIICNEIFSIIEHALTNYVKES